MTEDQIKNIINSNADSSYLVLKKDDEVFIRIMIPKVNLRVMKLQIKMAITRR